MPIKSSKIFIILILTALLTQGCSSQLPAFSDEELESNPIISQLKNSSVITDRVVFFKANESILARRRLEILRQHPSMTAGPLKNNENGNVYWWESIWLADFKISFISQQLSPTVLCLDDLLKPLDAKLETHKECEGAINAFKKEWDLEQQNQILQKISLRPTMTSLYAKTLRDELRLFDEAYRMQLIKK